MLLLCQKHLKLRLTKSLLHRFQRNRSTLIFFKGFQIYYCNNDGGAPIRSHKNDKK
ncbi:hypothetical protein NEOC95_001157 [Neochlamydia sp. AcF95]|nr:hypothetical protein [Neochlamydia sp. AcF95]